MHPLMQSVIKGVKENDLKYCVEQIIRERVKRQETGDSPGGSHVSGGGHVSGVGHVSGGDYNSVYRETLFLTLVSLGQDNIDLTAFDRWVLCFIKS